MRGLHSIDSIDNVNHIDTSGDTSGPRLAFEITPNV